MIEAQPQALSVPADPEQGSALRQGLLLFLISMLAFMTLQILPGTVTNEDGSTRFGLRSRSFPLGDSPYHVRMAYLYRTGAIAEAGQNFHWMSDSIWSDAFANKEFLFHLYLVPFTLGADDISDTTALIWGGKVASAVLMSLLMVTVFAALRCFGVRHAWAYVPLVIALGGWVFCSRAEELRAWPMGVICSLTGWVMMARNRRIELALVAAIFTLAYSAVHFLVILWAVRTVLMLVWGPEKGATRRSEFKANLWLLAAILGGILLGALLHPNRDGFMRMWAVTYLLVPAGILKGAARETAFDLFAALGISPGYSTEEASRMLLGMEFLPLAGTDLLVAGAAPILAPMLLTLLSLRLRHRPGREAVLAGGAAVLVLFMFLNSLRFAEIMGPFMALAVGLWLDSLFKSRRWHSIQRKRPQLPGLLKKAAAALAFLAATGVLCGLIAIKDPNLPVPWRDAALFMRDSAGDSRPKVFHAQWDVFPALFFYAPNCDYLVGMDPNYMLAHDVEKSRLIWDVFYGKVEESTLSRIQQLFKPDWLYVDANVTPVFGRYCEEQVEKGTLERIYKDAYYGHIAVYRVVKRGG